jgi:hypothetical protein
MRRPPLVALLLFSLLGFSGCAGVSRRLDWSSPSAAGVDTDETPAPNRFSWWRRPQAESTTTNSAGYFAQVNKADPPAASTKAPGNVWPEPEPKSDWMVRYFPHLSRLWNGNATKNSSDAEPASDVARVSSRPRPPAAAHAGRADDDVRPSVLSHQSCRPPCSSDPAPTPCPSGQATSSSTSRKSTPAGKAGADPTGQRPR